MKQDRNKLPGTKFHFEGNNFVCAYCKKILKTDRAIQVHGRYCKYSRNVYQHECDGCQYEFDEALNWQKTGYHYATWLKHDDPFNPNKHFIIKMVDNNGKLVVE